MNHYDPDDVLAKSVLELIQYLKRDDPSWHKAKHGLGTIGCHLLHSAVYLAVQRLDNTPPNEEESE